MKLIFGNYLLWCLLYIAFCNAVLAIVWTYMTGSLFSIPMPLFILVTVMSFLLSTILYKVRHKNAKAT